MNQSYLLHKLSYNILAVLSLYINLSYRIHHPSTP